MGSTQEEGQLFRTDQLANRAAPPIFAVDLAKYKRLLGLLSFGQFSPKPQTNHRTHTKIMPYGALQTGGS
jgi:hypothetical protein